MIWEGYHLKMPVENMFIVTQWSMYRHGLSVVQLMTIALIILRIVLNITLHIFALTKNGMSIHYFQEMMVIHSLLEHDDLGLTLLGKHGRLG